MTVETAGNTFPIPSAPSQTSAEDASKKVFIGKVFSRYMTMLGSLAIGAYVASLLPTYILFSGLYFVVSLLVYFAVVTAYLVSSVFSDEGSHDSFNEFSVGFVTGLFVSASFVSFNLLLPGQLAVAVFVTASMVMASVSYVAMSVLTKDLAFLKSVDKYVAGFSKFVLSTLVFAIFLDMFAAVSGIYLFSFMIEIALFVMFSMTLLANIYNVIENQSVISSSGKPINCGNNPSYAALILFLDTVNLLLEVMQLMLLINRYKNSKDKEGMDWSQVGTKLIVIGSMLVTGMWLASRMMKNEVRSTEVYEAATSAPPSYAAATGGEGANVDSPPPAYDGGAGK